MMTKKTSVDHDQVFKNIIIENPIDTITFAIPESKGMLKSDPEIIPIREETLKDTFPESFFRLDVPILVKFGKNAFVFLIEHQHDKYKFSIYKLNQYVLKLEEFYKCSIIPIVFFPKASFDDPSIIKQIRSEYLGTIYHLFTYKAICLKDYDSIHYLKSDNLFGRLMLPFMKGVSQNKVKILRSIIRALYDFIDDKDVLKRIKYFKFIDYYLEIDEPAIKEFIELTTKTEQKEVQMITETWEKEGIKKGILKGIKEGKIEQGLIALRLLLPQKFPQIPSELDKRLFSQTQLDKINNILSHFMEINTLEELEKYLSEESVN